VATTYWLRQGPIQRILDARAWSQAGLASDIQIDRVTLLRYLHGQRPVGLRSRRRLIAWAAANDLTPDDLLERRPRSPNPAEDTAD
jgi:transcriptional regulator with XRE-family HTH domain